MKALSVCGILMSLVGILACIYIMTAANCNCYCSNDFSFGSNGVPKEAMQGALAGLVAFIFFMIFSIVGAARSFATNSPIATAPPVPYPPIPQSYPPYPQPNPYYQQPAPPFPQQYPYQQPQNPPPPANPPADDPMSPWAPKQ